MKPSVFIMIIFILIGCMGDQDLTTTNAKIVDALEKRKAAYRSDILSNCHREIYEKAKYYVDSLISAEINFQLSDSIVFPPKPIKPTSPGPILVPDTIKARPVF